MKNTPSRHELRAGLVVDVEVGAALTLHPAPGTRSIIVRVLDKTGRRARLRVQAHDAVPVTVEGDELSPSTA